MKALKALQTFILLITFVGLISCDNNKEISPLSVENYIELLKTNQYDSLDLPAFNYNDIPVLLKYRSETQVITNFPNNPISSLYAPECTLGMYVLWTIESIRVVSIQRRYLRMRFPSQNPILALRDSAELNLVYDEASHEIAAKVYYDWWENNKQKNFSEFNNIEPLAETSYRWH